jgi:hypothetical protein
VDLDRVGVLSPVVRWAVLAERRSATKKVLAANRWKVVTPCLNC